MKAKEIVEIILQNEGISGLELCRRLNVGNDTIRSITSGKVCKISTKLADGIVELFPHYNKLWILTGEGEMYNETEKEPSDKTEDSMKKLVNELLTTVSMMQEEARAMRELIQLTNERQELQHSEFLAVLKMMRSMGITFAPMSTSEPHPGMVAEDSTTLPPEE